MIRFSVVSLRLLMLMGWICGLPPHHNLVAQSVPLGVASSIRYDSAAISRIADFGRVWGVIR
ncbi:hypothetical protein, partial [Spirosoma endbachense]|uniref:hypothetical protein n=1 Tax=Spirosoma endbachense TaxID=2666025 RepID=UPI001E4AC323